MLTELNILFIEGHQENFMYYLSNLFDPLEFDHSIIERLKVNPNLKPLHVFKMAQRLGINLKNNHEVDFVWIPYLMLLFPLPERKINEKITGNKQ
jgi:hypothetical protein